VTDRNTKDRPQQCQCDPHESVGDDEAPNRRGTVYQAAPAKNGMGMRKCDAIESCDSSTGQRLIMKQC
jgi:hypothetical protein